MLPIQAENTPFLFPKTTFWFWAAVNFLIPLIGVLFLGWDIFGLVYLFWWELICWGFIGVLKILSSFGSGGGFITQLASRIMALLFFVPLYSGLLMIVVSFSFVKFDSETVVSGTNATLGTSLIFITLNYVFAYLRSEYQTGAWRWRQPMAVVFERMLFALPLSCLVLFAVIPLADKFEGGRGETVVALGMVFAKGLMDIATYYVPQKVRWNETREHPHSSEETTAEENQREI